MNEEATASDSPLIQGRNARLYGKPRSSCPYADGSPEQQGWIDGFTGADAVTAGEEPEEVEAKSA